MIEVANQNVPQPNNNPITVTVPNLEETLSHGKADLSIGLVPPSRVSIPVVEDRQRDELACKPCHKSNWTESWLVVILPGS